MNGKFKIGKDTTFTEIKEKAGKLSEYMRFIAPRIKVNPESCTVEEYSRYQTDAVVDGLNWMWKQLESGEAFFTDIYTESEKKESEDKRYTQLSFFPSQKGAPFVLIISGGGYFEVCSMLEGVPIGYRFHERGYNVFLLHYRTNQIGIMPKPIEDVGAALHWIEKNQEGLGVSLNQYLVAGFSAGGHLAAEWGTTNEGYAKYHLPAPKMLILAYPVTAVHLYEAKEMNKVTDPIILQNASTLMPRMFGENPSDEMVNQYSIDRQIDENYPRTFIIHSEDDNLVPLEGTLLTVKSFEKFNVPYRFIKVFQSGHGFGLGWNGTEETKGWLDKAIDYYESFGKL